MSQSVSTNPSTPVTAVEATYPLSSLQQGMLYHYLLAPGSGVDIEQLVCTLREPLQAVTLRKAWEKVAARHDVLRTSFRWKDLGQAMQEVHAAVTVPWFEEDWRELPAVAQEQKLAAYLKADRTRGFVMSDAPMLRLALFRRAEAHFELVWTFHHAVLDGHSFGPLLNEVFGFYSAMTRGESYNPPLPRPYREYIEWHAKLDSSRSEDFWRQLLKGFTAPTPLAVGHTSQDESTARQGDLETWLSPATTAALQNLAVQNQLTLNTVVQGAWALLLHRYSGEKDVIFGAARACRRSAVAGADDMVGLFINTLPVRASIEPTDLLLPWLARLRAQWVAMREHEHTPLVEVQTWSNVPAGTPLFESIIVFDNALLNTALRSQGGDWLNREFRLYEQTGFPVTLAASSGDALNLKIEFDRSHFDDATIIRMLGHLRTLLESIATNPQQKLGDIPLLTEAERNELFVTWNATAQAGPSPLNVHHAFEAQVERTPDAPAVVFEERTLTYGELNNRANQLAHHLRNLGVKPETLVGVCVERSLEMVIALLAIHKAGGAYVPLDPDYPKDRVAFVLDDAQAAVMLTQESIQKRFEFSPSKFKVVTLDKDWESKAGENTANPTDGAKADNAAYVIYTSGSTGRPKGVVVTHGALANFLASMRIQPGLTPQDTLLAITTLSFDIAGLELFLPLVTGAKVVVARRETVVDGAQLVQTIAESGATVMQATPATWRALLDAGWSGNSRLKILCGGEAWSVELAQQLLPRCASLWNMYGPTETTVWSAVSQIEAGQDVLIGGPIANTQLYVLAGNRQPVPIGVPGELHIGGDGLARGYLNRPELTGDKFIPDPFSQKPGAHLYKTGDLVRYRADGRIEFLGRLDHQVKVRGFRIELGEIEAVLAQHPGIKDSVVVARENQNGDKALAAYLVPAQETAPPPGDLRVFLKEKLPDYMVPSFFVPLKSLPLTPNGKVDRRALPAPEQRSVDAERKFVPASDPLEVKLAEIWEKVLGTRPIGVADNFYDLGGHSLLAVRLFAQIEKVLGKNLPLTAIFGAPTIGQLAAIIRHQGGSPARSSLVAIQPAGTKPPLFCVPPDDGTVLCFGDLARRLGNDQPFYGLEPVEMWGQKLINYYTSQIRSCQPTGPYYLAGRCGGALIALRVAHELISQGQKVAFLGMFGVGFPPGYQHPPFYMLRRLLYLLRHNPTYILNPRLTLYNLQTKLFVFNRRLKKRIALVFTGVKKRQVQGVLSKPVETSEFPVHQVYPGRITLFETNDETLAAWSKLAARGAECHTIKTGHITMLIEPHVEVLAGQLQGCLAAARAEQ